MLSKRSLGRLKKQRTGFHHAADKTDHLLLAALVIASATTGMRKHALSYDSPLYGRRTAQMPLAPLSFTDIYAVQEMPFDWAVERHAVTGGMPKYLAFFQDDRELLDPIKEVIKHDNTPAGHRRQG